VVDVDLHALPVSDAVHVKQRPCALTQEHLGVHTVDLN
jgi:hypothetical protein